MTEPTNDPDDPRQRDALVRELHRQGIRDERVLEAIARVPRDRFVPESFRRHAWDNVALPIGSGQTISQPFVVALMTSALALTGVERVLEIGTGSGYQAAVLAELAREVLSIERHAPLAQEAAERLRALGYRNLRVIVADGSRGWPDAAPYDRIIVTAGAPHVSPTLVDQLSPDGGRMVVPVGDQSDQNLMLIERAGEATHERNLGPVRFVPLIGRAGWHVSVAENGHRPKTSG